MSAFTKDHPYLDGLIKRHGVTRASEMLGLAPSSLSSMLSEGTRLTPDYKGVRLVYEIAAEKLIADESGRSAKDTLFMVQVEANNHDALQAMLDGLQGKLVKKYSVFKF